MTRPTGIKTDGIGSHTKAHLNLTRSLADAEKPDPHRQSAANNRVRREYERQSDAKKPYAGKEQ